MVLYRTLFVIYIPKTGRKFGLGLHVAYTNKFARYVYTYTVTFYKDEDNDVMIMMIMMTTMISIHRR